MTLAAVQPNTFENLNPQAFAALAHDLTARLSRSSTLEFASQALCSSLYELFPESIALVRQYVTMPFSRLPPAEQGKVTELAGYPLGDDTPILTLLGTRGAMRDWNDRRHSRGHLGIALTDSAAVERIPMVASLLHALGVDARWLDGPREIYVRRLAGGLNGLFHVDDAREAKDSRGRHIIPARNFVDEHEVRTVFGMGGAYLNGWLCVTVVFTREKLTPSQTHRFHSLATTFKLATMAMVVSGRIFDRAH